MVNSTKLKFSDSIWLPKFPKFIVATLVSSVKFEPSLIFKFEMSAVVKFHGSKFQPSSVKLPVVPNMECTNNSEIRRFLELNFWFFEFNKFWKLVNFLNCKSLKIR